MPKLFRGQEGRPGPWKLAREARRRQIPVPLGLEGLEIPCVAIRVNHSDS